MLTTRNCVLCGRVYINDVFDTYYCDSCYKLRVDPDDLFKELETLKKERDHYKGCFELKEYLLGCETCDAKSSDHASSCSKCWSKIVDERNDYLGQLEDIRSRSGAYPDSMLDGPNGYIAAVMNQVEMYSTALKHIKQMCSDSMYGYSDILEKCNFVLDE